MLVDCCQRGSRPNMEFAGNVKTDSTGTSEDNPSRLLFALSSKIERLVTRNEECIELLPTTGTNGLYEGTHAPDISISKYLQRIHRYTQCSLSCFVTGFVFIDQLIHRQPDFPLVRINVHRLLLTSIMVATKFLDDVHFNNAFYAKVGGISVLELNYLEVDFLFRLKFRLHVTSMTYQGYCSHLERELLSMRGDKIEKPLPCCHVFPDEATQPEP
ncbi:hypothetical protein KP509_06G038700 [Ceratopteris richardii]|uniref:Cyclin n=1 Tax=Ceratopteris richardii TaxID=49495 RepID=A0A8T2ULX3_CERRI|nr:hypothetical protein KP509_06G038700 [Ceratopteris richardii]